VERYLPIKRNRRYDAMARILGIGKGVYLVVGQGQEDVGKSGQCRV